MSQGREDKLKETLRTSDSGAVLLVCPPVPVWDCDVLLRGRNEETDKGLPGATATRDRQKLPPAQPFLLGGFHLPFAAQQPPRPEFSGCSWASITPTHMSAPVPVCQLGGRGGERRGGV